MKNKKTMIILGVIICVVLVVLLIIESTLKKSKNDNNNVVNNIVNQNVNQSATNKINNTVDNEVENNIIDDTPVVVKTANELYKEKLLDKDWVKENLYMKTDCFGDAISSTQEQSVKYIKISDNTFSNPVVLIYTECESKNSNQMYALTYNNGELLVISINQNSTHNSHTVYNVNGRNKILTKSTTYADYEEYDIFNITNSGVQKSCTIKMQNVKNGSNIVTEYYYNGNKTTESQYTTIKNQYIQESARGETFKVLSSENLNISFPT